MDPKPPNPDEIESFRKEIGGIIKEQAEVGREAHFFDINLRLEELTEEDMDIWKKIKDGTITEDDFSAYRASVKSETSETRLAFFAFAANKAMGPINREGE